MYQRKAAPNLLPLPFVKLIQSVFRALGLFFIAPEACNTLFSFEKLLQEKQVVRSFSRSAKPHDNAVFFLLPEERRTVPLPIQLRIRNFKRNRKIITLYTTKLRVLPKKPFIIMKKAKIWSNKSVRIAAHFIFCHSFLAFLAFYNSTFRFALIIALKAHKQSLYI